MKKRMMYIMIAVAMLAGCVSGPKMDNTPVAHQQTLGDAGRKSLPGQTANWLRVTTFPEPMLFAPTSMGDFAKYLERASKDFAEPLSLEARRGISFHCSDSAAKKVFPPRSAQTVPLIPDGQSQRVVTFWQALTNACERADCAFEVVPGTVYIHSKHEFAGYD